MIAADATPTNVEPLLTGVADVWIANHNSPRQTVIAGTEDGLKAASEKLQGGGHSVPADPGRVRVPLAADRRGEGAAGRRTGGGQASPRRGSRCTRTRPPPRTPPTRTAIAGNWPITSSRRCGSRTKSRRCTPPGPGVRRGRPAGGAHRPDGQILAGKPHLAVASDVKSRPGLVQLAHLLGQLLAGGASRNLDRLFAAAACKRSTSRSSDPTPASRSPRRRRGWSTASAAGRSTAPNRGCSVRRCRSIGTSNAGITTRSDRENQQVRWAERPRPARKTHPHSHPLPSSPRRVSLPRPPFPSPTSDDERHRDPLSDQESSPHRGQRSVTCRPRRRSSRDDAVPGCDGPVPRHAAERHARLSGIGEYCSWTLGERQATHPLNGRSPQGYGAVATGESPRRTRPAQRHPGGRIRRPTASTQPALEANGKPSRRKSAEFDIGKSAERPLDRETLLAQLLDLVSERTGYPKEALEHRPRPRGRPRHRLDQARRDPRRTCRDQSARPRTASADPRDGEAVGHQDAPRDRRLLTEALEVGSAANRPRADGAQVPADPRASTATSTPAPARATCSGSSCG